MIYPKDPSAWEMARGRIKEWRPIYMDKYTYPPEFKETKMKQDEYVKVKKEDLIKVHKESCGDVKKVLEGLYPGELNKKVVNPYDIGAQVRVDDEGYMQIKMTGCSFERPALGIILTPSFYNENDIDIVPKPGYPTWFKLEKNSWD